MMFFQKDIETMSRKEVASAAIKKVEIHGGLLL